MYVPKLKRTEELCLEAFRNNVDAFKFFPDKLRTTELYLDAVKRGLKNFDPSRSKTLENEKEERVLSDQAAAKDAGPNSMKLKTLGGRKTRKRRKFVKGVS